MDPRRKYELIKFSGCTFGIHIRNNDLVYEKDRNEEVLIADKDYEFSALYTVEDWIFDLVKSQDCTWRELPDGNYYLYFEGITCYPKDNQSGKFKWEGAQDPRITLVCWTPIPCS